ncbi:MAG: methyl-accepting chemotaxis protein [Methylobacter sp.]|nr:methyl-accepting chemotaxis protein [Methylobacter sp.]MDP2099244.1 methyl-accepting chemotaxis protein [Methylobacter sp.]MDP2426609.1 methyl-accepting chemotaxis protein [Methylobacter sp.]MDP3055427.1 methyl-accepting chemotaxis protein [Methylobacter sp.]MDP3364287.1 methyl-accepting chemotaxis protein [Methylobacter sp.]
MKINHPVIDEEYVLTENDAIVSNTDLNGVITYVNDTFIHASGYAREELLGVSHNIVRHPDMPAEAFADLWGSMKAGRPWTGLVKNRRKNGGYYWVLANVTPIHENDELIGYMSVRSKPEREHVEAADRVYRLFREGKANNLRIQDGRIVKAGRLAWLNRFKHFSIKSRLLAIVSLFSLLLLVIGSIGLFSMNKDEEGLQVMYENRMLPSSRIALIQQLLLNSKLDIAASLTAPSFSAVLENTTEVERNIEQIAQLKEQYLSGRLSNEEKILLNQFANSKNELVEAGFMPAIAALRANNMTQANRFVMDRINSLYQPVGQSLHKLMQLQLDMAKQEYSGVQLRHNTIRNISIALIALGIPMVTLLGFKLIAVIIEPLEASIGHFSRIAQGDYNNVITIERRNEVSNVMEALKSMQIKLGFEVAETRRIANENLRVKIALDNVSTGVMIADHDGRVIYANKAINDILNKSEPGIHEKFPDFSVERLIGSRIELLHQNPDRLNELLDPLNDSFTDTMELGGRSITVVTSQVTHEDGQHLGWVAEWRDRTAEVAVEKEVSTIVVASTMGDFTKHFDLRHKVGFLRELGEGLNQLLYTSETGLNEVVRVLSALSRGDLTETITNEYCGTFGQLKNDSNTTVEKLKQIVNQIRMATDNISAGAKEIAHGNNELSYRTEQQAASLEQTAASMQQLTATVHTNAENAQQANRLAIGASEVAGMGSIIVGQVISTMDEINEASYKITEIVSVIDDIAFQTNILAFNAAIEAARAGVQGQGFAVVASEVRHLAQRASASAGEIKSIIEHSVEKINEGSKLATKAGFTMEEILSTIHGVAGMMSEITAASVEQSAGIEQINQAITQIDDVTQQNAALVEQSAVAAAALDAQAQNLALAVGSFKTNDSPCPQLSHVR